MARRKGARKHVRRQARPLATNLESLKTLREWLLPDESIFSTLKFHGNIKWRPTFLVWLVLCWAWSEARHLTDSFTESIGSCQKMFGCMPLTTYQGFMWTLVAWTSRLLPPLRVAVQQRMEQINGKFWRINGWVPIAFDGSRSTAPRTRSNETAFCAANYGQGKTAKYRKKKSKGMRRKKNEKNKAQPQEPQAWITMMWHMALRLPWSWRLGPSNSSERAHVMDIIATEVFPRNTLFCGDAGFVGYPLWSALLDRGHHFLVRVGANVSLLMEQARCTFEKRGRKQAIVLCWPKTAMVAKQHPVRLRLLRVRIGKISAWMLTSILERDRLKVKAVVRFYRMRWGIEVEFRGLKQTLDRAKLRSRNHKRLLVELDWSILAMAIAELFACKEQQASPPSKSRDHDPPPDPAKRSLAQTMRALRSCLRNPNEVPGPRKDLPSLLRTAITDNYHRNRPKQARYRPMNPDKKPLGDPKLRPISPLERQIIRAIHTKMAA